MDTAPGTLGSQCDRYRASLLRPISAISARTVPMAALPLRCVGLSPFLASRPCSDSPSSALRFSSSSTTSCPRLLAPRPSRRHRRTQRCKSGRTSRRRTRPQPSPSPTQFRQPLAMETAAQLRGRHLNLLGRSSTVTSSSSNGSRSSRSSRRHSPGPSRSLSGRLRPALPSPAP